MVDNEQAAGVVPAPLGGKSLMLLHDSSAASATLSSTSAPLLHNANMCRKDQFPLLCSTTAMPLVPICRMCRIPVQIGVQHSCYGHALNQLQQLAAHKPPAQQHHVSVLQQDDPADMQLTSSLRTFWKESFEIQVKSIT